MMNGKAMDQMLGMQTTANSGRHVVGRGEAQAGVCSDQATPTHHETLNTGQGLLEAALDRSNL